MRVPVAYSDDLLKWQLGEGHPTNPIRAKLATEMLAELLGSDLELVVPESVSLELLSRVHDAGYLEKLSAGWSSEWEGERPDLWEVARLMCGGTVQVFERMMADPSMRVGFSPMGAKHHAFADYGSGFCTLNDMALVAHLAMERGMRVGYLDVDVHHGDGTEDLLRGCADAATLSIHQWGIFPGTGWGHMPERGVWNWPLQAGAGDAALLGCVRAALEELTAFKPDLLLLAAGADGLGVDPLGGLEYSIVGLCEAAGLVGAWAATRGLPIVVGGAGGYTPLRETPMAWAGVVATLVGAYQKVA